MAQKVSSKLAELEEMVQAERARCAQLREQPVYAPPSVVYKEGPYSQCFEALQQSMLHNFTFLEFYKDLQAYVSPRLALGDETALAASQLML